MSPKIRAMKVPGGENLGVVEGMCAVVAMQLEAEAEKRGWDLHPLLVEITMDPLDETERDMVFALIREEHRAEGEDLDVESPLYGQKLDLRIVPVGEDEWAAEIGPRDHPLDYLDGRVASEDAVGCGLVVEGWGYSPKTLERIREGEEIPYKPSEDPDRVEHRQVFVMMRDGTLVGVSRTRGMSEAKIDFVGGSSEEDLEVKGRLIDSLCRFLQIPTGPPTRSLRETTAATLLTVWLTTIKEHNVAASAVTQIGTTLNLLGGAVGSALVPVLISSGLYEEWEEGAGWAAEQLQNVKSHIPEEARGEAELWARRLKWYDAGMLERAFDWVPAYEAVEEKVRELMTEKTITPQDGYVLLSAGQKVRKNGFQPL